MKVPLNVAKIRNNNNNNSKWRRKFRNKLRRRRSNGCNQVKPDSFSIFLRTKINFMKLLGLKSISQAVENIALESNNDSLFNNIDLTIIDNTIEILCIGAINCPKCEIIFSNKKAYNLHLSKCHPDLLQFYCKICSIKFLNRTLLQEHQSKHRGKNPYTCSKCNVRLKTLDLFIAHMRKHQGKLPYSCEICKKAFDKNVDYKRHLLVHEMKPFAKSKRKFFTCTDCCKQFQKACDLKRHQRVHTGEKPFVCAVCGTRFQQAHNMTKHMTIHTKERKYCCDICTKEFGRKDVLTRHMLTHTINKPFSCDVCRKTFARAVQLTTHKMKCH